MTTPTQLLNATSLESLLSLLRSPAGGSLGMDRAMGRLPTFGGEAPRDTAGVWSWDAKRLLVGTCASDMRLVSRDQA